MFLPSNQVNIDWKLVAEVVGAAVALATLIKGTLEYAKQGAQQRTELFLEMDRRFLDFLDVCNLLEREDHDGLVALPFSRKLDFIGFYEELAMMMHTGLLRRSVVHYMFGYYAISCWESDAFWSGENGLSRQSQYWALFGSFAQQMQRERFTFLRRKFNPKRYQL